MGIGPEFHKNYWWIRVGIAVVLLLVVNVIPVLAHSGRTDSDGGHTVSATGEYHWHHGYPAHQHYDVDGDGLLECPYDSSIGGGDQRSAAKSTGSKAAASTGTASNTGSTSAVVGWTAAGVAGITSLALLKRRDKAKIQPMGPQKQESQAVDGLSRKIVDQEAQIQALQREIEALKQKKDLDKPQEP